MVLLNRQDPWVVLIETLGEPGCHTQALTFHLAGLLGKGSSLMFHVKGSSTDRGSV